LIDLIAVSVNTGFNNRRCVITFEHT